jgi:hypothetical protein
MKNVLKKIKWYFMMVEPDKLLSEDYKWMWKALKECFEETGSYAEAETMNDIENKTLKEKMDYHGAIK